MQQPKADRKRKEERDCPQEIMDRDNIIKYISVALAAVALVLGIATSINVSNVKNSISFDTSVDVAVAGVEAETAVTGETATTEETAAAEGTETATAEAETAVEEGTENAEGEAVSSSEGAVNIILRDGVLKLVDSYIRVPSADGSDSNICVYLSGENSVRYNSQSNYLVVNGQTIIKAINASDVTYNGISEFMGSDGSPILIGERQINETSGIAVVYNLGGTSPAPEEDVTVVQDILNNAKSGVSITGLTLFWVQANPDWAEDIIMTDKAVQLIKGNSSVYVSPYTGSFAGGTTNTLDTGSISFSYSDSIMDTSTGYTPYIYEFSSDQNGMAGSGSSSSSTLQAKFLAQNNRTLVEIFG